MKNHIPLFEQFVIYESRESYIASVKTVMPDYEEIEVSDEDKKEQKQMYKDTLDDDIWKDTGSLNNVSDDKLNKGIMKIIAYFKKKYPNANWDVIKKPMFDSIHGGLT